MVGASVELSQCERALSLGTPRVNRVFFFLIAIINVVNFYLDQPNVVNQLRASGTENPVLDGYIYEAMRKCYNPPVMLLALMFPLI